MYGNDSTILFKITKLQETTLVFFIKNSIILGLTLTRLNGSTPYTAYLILTYQRLSQYEIIQAHPSRNDQLYNAVPSDLSESS